MSEKPTYEELLKRVQELETAEAMCKASDQKYASLFNQSADGIYLHDMDGDIVDANKSAVNQSGFSRDELLQMNVFDLHPDIHNREDILRRGAHGPRASR